MAWIPSHQELRDHPKTRRAARRAGVSIPTIIGHLHLIWHWALDHAPDGDLDKYDAEDIADAAMWEDDPETLVKALVECGPGGTQGFITDGWKLHDWDEYGGAYARRVAAARKAARTRWSDKNNADALRTKNEGNADALQGQCGDDAQDRTGQEKDLTLPSPDGDAAAETGADDAVGSNAPTDDDRFEEHFWPVYPPMPNGKKPEKGKALQQWRKLTIEQQRRAVLGARNLARADTIPKHAHRFLRRDTAGEFPFDDWQTAPTVNGAPPAPERPCPLCGEPYVPASFDGGVPAGHGCPPSAWTEDGA